MKMSMMCLELECTLVGLMEFGQERLSSAFPTTADPQFNRSIRIRARLAVATLGLGVMTALRHAILDTLKLLELVSMCVVKIASGVAHLFVPESIAVLPFKA